MCRPYYNFAVPTSIVNLLSNVFAKMGCSRLRAQEFACDQDAIDAAESFSKQLKYHCLTDILAVELLTDQTIEASLQTGQSQKSSYRIQATLIPDQSVIETETRRAGRFVLATNVMEVSALSNDEMLKEYKAQQAAERGLGFLKDPLFFTDSVFLKSPERIEALAMLMGKWFVSLYFSSTAATLLFVTLELRN